MTSRPDLDAARLVPGWSPEDKLRLYAVFGGLPGHLALVDPGRTLAENAARHLLDLSGRLHDEAAHVFDAFLADAAVSRRPNRIDCGAFCMSSTLRCARSEVMKRLHVHG